MLERAAAGFNIAGSLLGAFGSLYLAFDLLGGKEGPLSLITRIVTYGIFFGIGYGLGLGVKFGLVAGVGLGLVLCLEFWTAPPPTEGSPRSTFRRDVVLGITRSLVLAIALGTVSNHTTALVYFLFGAPLLVALNMAGFTPTRTRRVLPRPDLNRSEIIASILRGLAAGIALLITIHLVKFNQPLDGAYVLRFALTLGLTSLGLGIMVPVVEWWTHNAPERWVAAVGALCVVFGFFLQSVPYWVTLLK